ncbi:MULTISPECIES: hypothetical protein [Micrococcus]|uniref:hypothetical protein n=1 Tax=Micrococcus TaxID=1269 RepID=UPI0009901B4A|nr:MULTISPECIES: hypothetical protein [Micrococcus]MCO0633341.1 hypothetical protein [Micrococcus yunnanensis]MCV7601979.1 hypothetical protein [Micrococcus luteus]PAK75784.1 hypothetical protein B8W89_04135 [Micrococcus luteus]QDW17868.1 hypothetical protein B1A86_00008325 [Micrococcus sp. KBS0714]
MTGHDHPRPESISAAVDEQMLADFLNQHLLGSRSGVKAFRAAEQTWAGTPQEAALRRLGDAVQDDQDRLEALIGELGLRTPLVDRAAGAAAEVGGRLNPVNALRTRGSGWTQIELDLLQGMLQAKSAMWDVLEQLAPHLPAVDAAEMQALRQRTADQQREVQRITSATLEGRFLAG